MPFGPRPVPTPSRALVLLLAAAAVTAPAVGAADQSAAHAAETPGAPVPGSPAAAAMLTAYRTSPAAVSHGGRLTLFGQGPAGEVLTSTYTKGSFRDTYDLGGRVTGGVSAARSEDGRTAVAVQGTNGAVYVKTGQSAGWAADWAGLGGLTATKPAIVPEGPSRYRVFVRGTNGVLYTASGADGSWSGWTSLGGALAQHAPAAATAGGELRVFVVGVDGQVWTRSLRAGSWSGWTALGGRVLGDLSAAAPAAGRASVFVRGTNDKLYVRSVSGSTWTGWGALGGSLSAGPAVSLDVTTGGMSVVTPEVAGALHVRNLTAAGWGSPALLNVPLDGDIPPAPVAPPLSGGWKQVYRHDFTSMTSVIPMRSSPTSNSELLPKDTIQNKLQRPTVPSNVVIVADAAARDSSALAVYTRPASYSTLNGTAFGWANGRMMLAGHNQSPPFRIRTRIKMTASIGVKTAVMWWPERGWPWEVDFAETFGGSSLTDYWGSRQHVSQRWHGDVNGDGQAREQKIHNIALDATKYHDYDLFVTRDKMWIEIDGVTHYSTTDRRFIPNSPGFFSIGKALTHGRHLPHTQDAVYVDYVELYKPAG
ncbi:MAG: family 16 glycosylhydrolase [Actinomycetota bacterium]|nr:family 16 glycosylhydrolase [Actinomycetota bacterium]